MTGPGAYKFLIWLMTKNFEENFFRKSCFAHVNISLIGSRTKNKILKKIIFDRFRVWCIFDFFNVQKRYFPMSYTLFKVCVQIDFCTSIIALIRANGSEEVKYLKNSKNCIFSDIEDALDLDMPAWLGYHVRTPNTIPYHTTIR